MAAALEASTTRVSVTSKLPHLQNLIKRDPDGYIKDFEQQHRHFLSELEIYRLDPSKQKSESFGALVTFLSHVAACYPVQCRQFPMQLMDLLRSHGHTLHPDIRLTVLQALLLLRNRGLMQAIHLFPLLFDIMDVHDKNMRSLAYSHMVADLRKLHIGGGNGKMMRELQAFVCSTVDAVSSSNTEREVAGKRALDLLVELYRRQIWTDDRTVNAIASACLSPSMRIAVSAMRFFLGIESRIADDEQSDVQEALDMSINEHQHSKKTASRMRSTKKQKAARE